MTSAWQPIATAPLDRPFLARQKGEVFVAKYLKQPNPRLCFRAHQPCFEHNWVIWPRGFDFAPTEWAEVPQ